jgi:mitochondrial import receptor subunit TOM40
VKRVSDRLSLGVELESSLPDKDSSLKMGYDYTFRQARVQGMLDTAGKVSCFVSDFMGFGVSGMIDYIRGDYKFGFMMHIVPQSDTQGQQ